MKAVILAAGLGKRLRPLTNALPKGLIEIGGKTLLEHSLNALVKNGIKEIVIVTGFLNKTIEQKFGREYKDSRIKYVLNKEFSKTGSMYSLSQARSLINDNIILLESDLLYDPKAIRLLLNTNRKNAILVAPLSNSGDEVYICADDKQRIVELGKYIDDAEKSNAIGELVGISKFSKEFLDKLFKMAEKDYVRGKLNYHYEECVFQTSKLDRPVYAEVCKDLAWIEIDNENDLKRAKEQIYPKVNIYRVTKTESWRKIWERKGILETNDLKKLDGFEATTVNPREIAKKISEILKIQKTDKVLEVGCGAGMIAQYLDCDYIGIDYSKSLVKKHVEILKHSVLVAEADNIPFKDKYFDKAFSYSVFHYFPNKDYGRKVIKEMKRVCKGQIFIGDLPITSHRKEHLLFNKDDFSGEISEGFYTKIRFNILIKSKKSTN